MEINKDITYRENYMLVSMEIGATKVWSQKTSLKRKHLSWDLGDGKELAGYKTIGNIFEAVEILSASGVSQETELSLEHKEQRDNNVRSDRRDRTKVTDQNHHSYYPLQW